MEVSNVSNVLVKLHIPYRETSSSKIQIICPFHPDKSFGSCHINSNTGLGYCFSCKEGFDVIKLVRHINRMSFQEALNFLNIKSETNNYKPSIVDVKSINTIIENKETKTIIHKDYSRLSLSDLNPSTLKYTNDRKMTYEFFRRFNVKLCNNGFYKDFLIFPIIDKIHNIVSYEARKVKEYEYLKLFFHIDKDVNIDRLRGKFDTYIKENNIRLRENKDLYKGEELILDDIILYLLLPKTFYPKGSFLGKPTIWNYEGLNRKLPLYVCEGLGSVPRLYSELSNNVTCTFGSMISDSQMEMLNEFTEIIIIKDNDNAGNEYINDFKHGCIAEIYIANTKLEDTDDLFIEEIKQKPLLYTVDKS